jgi:hypothetical protein
MMHSSWKVRLAVPLASIHASMNRLAFWTSTFGVSHEWNRQTLLGYVQRLISVKFSSYWMAPTVWWGAVLVGAHVSSWHRVQVGQLDIEVKSHYLAVGRDKGS